MFSFHNVAHFQERINIHWKIKVTKKLLSYLKEMRTFIQESCIKLILSDSKVMYNVKKDYHKKVLFWTLKDPEKKNYHLLNILWRNFPLW